MLTVLHNCLGCAQWHNIGWMKYLSDTLTSNAKSRLHDWHVGSAWGNIRVWNDLCCLAEVWSRTHAFCFKRRGCHDAHGVRAVWITYLPIRSREGGCSRSTMVERCGCQPHHSLWRCNPRCCETSWFSTAAQTKNQKRRSFSQRALAFIVIQERTGLHPYSLRLHFTWHYDIIDRYVITVVVSPLWYSCLQWIKLQESLYCVYKMHLALMEVMFQGLWIFALLSTTWLHNLITISQVPLGKSWMDAVADQK